MGYSATVRVDEWPGRSGAWLRFRLDIHRRGSTTQRRMVCTATIPGSSASRISVSIWNHSSSPPYSTNSRTAPAAKSATVIEASAARASSCSRMGAESVPSTASTTSGLSSSAIKSPSMPIPLLYQRGGGGAQIDALEHRAASEHVDILAQGPRLDHRLEARGNLVAHQLEGQDLAGDALVNGDDVEAETGLDQIARDPGATRAEQHLLEFRHRVTAPQLPKDATVLTGGAVRQLPRQVTELLRLLEQDVERLLRPRAYLRNVHRRRNLEENVPNIDEIATAKFRSVAVVVTAHLIFDRLGGRDFAAQELLHRLGNEGCVSLVGVQQPVDHGALAQQLAHRSELKRFALVGSDGDSVDRGGHG